MLFISLIHWTSTYTPGHTQSLINDLNTQNYNIDILTVAGRSKNSINKEWLL